ncbi:dehydrogenase [Ktedonospora formicarum]|uniref:Dehydrogenase n=1 Tax=Ktedonospora formicarum TaxID=2778364 RepID=A0A8J3HRE0_9CHLR|nr:dehydrogenase [Ktedonospora formicarum]
MEVNNKVNVGIIGCGVISSIYLEAPSKFDILNIVACADIDLDRARAQAEKYNVPKVCTVEELLADPDIDIVLNLTIPKVHAEIALAALQAGKSTYSEKPLGVSRAEAQPLLETARANNLRVGCAPDTFLGGGIQTCIKLINDGVIGTPVAATAYMMGHGPESWHPNPEFYYHIGGGPMFDMGPYYLTALISMLGPVRRVSGTTRITFPERLITSQPFAGQKINVQTPTHVVGNLDFVSGAIATVTTSFDIWSHEHPLIEIYGSEGSISVPDPNTFGGTVKVRRAGDREWTDVPLTHGNTENSRGIGVADMAHAIRKGTQHRANGEMAYHVLDIMQSIHESSNEGRHIELSSTCERPAPLPSQEPLW